MVASIATKMETTMETSMTVSMVTIEHKGHCVKKAMQPENFKLIQ